MANELQFDAGRSGLTVYGIARNNAGLFVFADGSTLEAFNAGHWSEYAIPMTEVGASGIYFGDFPLVAEGEYQWSIRKQTGGSPAVSVATDIRLGVGGGVWTGSAFAPAAVGSPMALQDASISESTIVTPPEAPGRPTGILGMLRRAFEGWHNKRTRDRATGQLLIRNEADSDNLESSVQSTSGTVDSFTQGS